MEKKKRKVNVFGKKKRRIYEKQKFDLLMLLFESSLYHSLSILMMKFTAEYTNHVT